MASRPSSDPEDIPQPTPPLAPGVRLRRDGGSFEPGEESRGYTSRGYVEHFLPDREVNVAALNKALADVFGEPALHGKKLELEIDEEYWKKIAVDAWSGNVYVYHF